MTTQITFPETLQEAVLYYSDPDNCLATAIRFRWPNGVTCPYCGADEPGFLVTRRIWKCRNRKCRKQFSAKVGTIFEDSPLGLDKWFVAMWLLCNAKNGISSWELHRAVGVTQKTAWFMLHRLRVALHLEDGDRLSGQVEADETYIGGKAANMHYDRRKEKMAGGRGVVGKAVVQGLLARNREKGKSRVKAKVVNDLHKEAVRQEVLRHVESGSELITDALPSYRHVADEYLHSVIDHSVA